MALMPRLAVFYVLPVRNKLVITADALEETRLAKSTVYSHRERAVQTRILTVSILQLPLILVLTRPYTALSWPVWQDSQ